MTLQLFKARFNELFGIAMLVFASSTSAQIGFQVSQVLWLLCARENRYVSRLLPRREPTSESSNFLANPQAGDELLRTIFSHFLSNSQFDADAVRRST